MTGGCRRPSGSPFNPNLGPSLLSTTELLTPPTGAPGPIVGQLTWITGWSAYTSLTCSFSVTPFVGVGCLRDGNVADIYEAQSPLTPPPAATGYELRFQLGFASGTDYGHCDIVLADYGSGQGPGHIVIDFNVPVDGTRVAFGNITEISPFHAVTLTRSVVHDVSIRLWAGVYTLTIDSVVIATFTPSMAIPPMSDATSLNVSMDHQISGAASLWRMSAIAVDWLG